ncbi:kinase-like domain-containing protein [Favolaschia claudopus]|uniref:Kinase-like domain-containing protein n=1 Tax=Favolaschia claudopus TaxID=2862362 RepID=A0AAW0BPX9_9AGAR
MAASSPAPEISMLFLNTTETAVGSRKLGSEAPPSSLPWTPTKLRQFGRFSCQACANPGSAFGLENLMGSEDNVPPGIRSRSQQLSDSLHSVMQFAASKARAGTGVPSGRMMFDGLEYWYIASGGYGKVFGFEIGNRPYVIKIRTRLPKTAQISHDEYLAEKRVLELLNNGPEHPNLLLGVQFCEKLNEAFPPRIGITVFKHHPGTLSNVRSIICHDDRIATRLYAAVIREIASGLNHLHSLKIIHKDIKPENILVSFPGHCIIADYGACEIKENLNPFYHPSSDNIHSYGGIVSEQFCPPEIMQLASNGSYVYDEASDWWSLGVTIYSLITGETWSRETARLFREALDPHRQQCMREAMFRYVCPADICGLVMKMCETDPKERIKDIVPVTGMLINESGGIISDSDAPFMWVGTYPDHELAWNERYGSKQE